MHGIARGPRSSLRLSRRRLSRSTGHSGGRASFQRAQDAALKLGLTAVGGSDAHFASAKWFMTVATELEREVKTVEELCAELRAGRARPYVFPGAEEGT